VSNDFPHEPDPILEPSPKVRKTVVQMEKELGEAFRQIDMLTRAMDSLGGDCSSKLEEANQRIERLEAQVRDLNAIVVP
jgi:polyhydroxyalkanoate synthesis regulator phasin